MDMSRKRDQQGQFESWGNLALVGESVGAPQSPKVRTLSLVPAALEENCDEQSEVDSLAPARGIVMGIGLSIVLWGSIIVVLSWIL